MTFTRAAGLAFGFWIDVTAVSFSVEGKRLCFVPWNFHESDGKSAILVNYFLFMAFF
ncbi:hypothetical protein [Cellvibrio sp. UBA7661]|uniref:hypothetical protein n=1 Tax=Cellvibrio sp. UBA7661 TaxID=1946311 RepID=UPI002F357CE4